MNKKRLRPSLEGGYPQDPNTQAFQQDRSSFKDLTASKLYCPKCRVATPVRERLLLVLPGSDNRYDYMCTQCGESVGTKTG